MRRVLFVTGMTLLAVVAAAALAAVLPGLILEVPPVLASLCLVLGLRIALDGRRSPPTLRVIDCS